MPNEPLSNNPLSLEEWDSLADLLRSPGWPVLLRFLREGNSDRERTIRSRKASIEEIRYAQGVLDTLDLLKQQLTIQNIKDWKQAIREHIQENQQDSEKS